MTHSLSVSPFHQSNCAIVAPCLCKKARTSSRNPESNSECEEPPEAKEIKQAKKKRRRKSYQRSIRPAHRPKKMPAKKQVHPATTVPEPALPLTPTKPPNRAPNDWTPRFGSYQMVPEITPEPSARQYVQSNYSKCVVKFGTDGSYFMCMCGERVDLTNANYKQNVRAHVTSSRCKVRRHKTTLITSFFGKTTPTKKFAVPDPQIFCRGLWTKSIAIKGVQCETELLGEYACGHLYYISGRVMEFKNSQGRLIKVTRSIHASQCLGHCLDFDGHCLPGNCCQECGNLLVNPDFRKMLLGVRTIVFTVDLVKKIANTIGTILPRRHRIPDAQTRATSCRISITLGDTSTTRRKNVDLKINSTITNDTI